MPAAIRLGLWMRFIRGNRMKALTSVGGDAMRQGGTYVPVLCAFRYMYTTQFCSSCYLWNDDLVRYLLTSSSCCWAYDFMLFVFDIIILGSHVANRLL